MMNVQDPPKPATVSATRSPIVSSDSIIVVRVARGAQAHELLRGVELAAEHAQHVHPGVRLPLAAA